MIIKSIEIAYGSDESFKTDFTSVNIIGGRNSVGKTTLLRLMIYGFGYSIPLTEGIKPNKCRVKMTLEEGGIEKTIIRHDNDITIDGGAVKKISLKSMSGVMGDLFNDETPLINKNVLENLLGTFYIDQERGWGLFNRGTVVGSIKFNIEQFLYGLSGVDDSEIFRRREKVNAELKNYSLLVSNLKKITRYDAASLFDYTDSSNSEKIQALQIQMDLLKNEIKYRERKIGEIRKTLNQNDKFSKYVEDLGLLVRSSDGEDIRVTKDRLAYLDDTQGILQYRITMEGMHISDLNKKFDKLKEELDSIDLMDRDIRDLGLGGIRKPSIDKATIQANEEIFRNVSNRLLDGINAMIDKSDCKKNISEKLLRYCEELKIPRDLLDSRGLDRWFTQNERGVEHENIVACQDDFLDPITVGNKLLMRKDFRGFSGSIGRKMVLAFRLAYLKTIAETYGVKMPIMIDSLENELDDENIEKVLSLIANEFADHQLIIASIRDLNIKDVNVIRIVNKLFKKNQTHKSLLDI